MAEFTQCTTHPRCVLAVLHGWAKFGCDQCNRFSCYALLLINTHHEAQCVKTWRYPQNQKNIVYQNVARGGLKHDHRQHTGKNLVKFDRLVFDLCVQQTGIFIIILHGGKVKNLEGILRLLKLYRWRWTRKNVCSIHLIHGITYLHDVFDVRCPSWQVVRMFTYAASRRHVTLRRSLATALPTTYMHTPRHHPASTLYIYK